MVKVSAWGSLKVLKIKRHIFGYAFNSLTSSDVEIKPGLHKLINEQHENMAFLYGSCMLRLHDC